MRPCARRSTRPSRGSRTAFKGQPAVEASIRDTLSEGYAYLGEPDLAIRQLKRVLELRRQRARPGPLRNARGGR